MKQCSQEVLKTSLKKDRSSWCTHGVQTSCTPRPLHARSLHARQRSQASTLTYPTSKNVLAQLALQAALVPPSETVKNACCEHLTCDCISGSQPAQNRVEPQFWTTRQRDNLTWWGGGGLSSPFYWWLSGVVAWWVPVGDDPGSGLLSAWATRQANIPFKKEVRAAVRLLVADLVRLWIGKQIPFKKTVGVLCPLFLLAVDPRSHRRTQVTRAYLSTLRVSFAFCFYWKAVADAIRVHVTIFVSLLSLQCLSFSEGNNGGCQVLRMIWMIERMREILVTRSVKSVKRKTKSSMGFCRCEKAIA